MNYRLVEEVRRAILRGEKTFRGYTLPKAQTSGTIAQVRAYGAMQASKFIDKHNLK